jgi:hypothetical protein
MKKPMLIAFLGFLLVPAALPDSVRSQHRTVLAIYSGERSYPANVQVENTLRESLGVDANPRLTYLTEFLDLSRLETRSMTSWWQTSFERNMRAILSM